MNFATSTPSYFDQEEIKPSYTQSNLPQLIPAADISEYLGIDGMYSELCECLSSEDNQALEKALTFHLQKKNRTHQEVVKFIDRYVTVILCE
jgi:hypothetical protein